LPETSNPEYSDVNVPNITVNLNDSYNARGNGANDVDQVRMSRQCCYT